MITSDGELERTKGIFLKCVGGVLIEVGLVDSHQRTPSFTYAPKGTVSVQV